MSVTYSEIKDRLLQCINKMHSMGNIRAFPYNELTEKIQNNTFNLVVVGQFKRGKTSLINALLGANILPVAVVPLTSIVTILTYGESLKVEVHFNEGRIDNIRPQDIADYVTEKGNPKNAKDVNEVVITYPSQYLKDGVRLIDTPGVGSIYQHNTDVAYQYLPKSDAALFLLSVDQPMSRAELDFLKDVKEYSNKIFFLLNKADYLNDKDLQESIEFSKGVLNEALGSEIKIFPISARLALEGSLAASNEMIKKSGLPEFTEVLNRFLIEDKGKVLILSVINTLLRHLSQTQFELELEQKSIATPLEELKNKIALFEAKKQEVLLEKQDFDILLEGEIKRLSRDVLDEDMTSFRKEILEQIQKDIQEEFIRVKHLPSKELKSALEQKIIEYVRQAFNVWRAKEDDKLAKAFESICKRFVVKIDDAVDTLLKFSSDLFEIPYEAIKAEAFWSTKSGFYYKFKEQPGAIEIVSSSLTLALPKFIGDKLILKKAEEFLIRTVDLQLGKSGNDFESRIQKSKLSFRWEMLQRIEATIEGISSAVQKGLAQKDRSSEDIDKRFEEISHSLGFLNALKNDLGIIKTIAGGCETLGFKQAEI
ncbi:MAG: dynamin family protein [Thermodesulfovibrionales bacterium]|nr:dynamin family protein [Thermodesulfovibrionales bacterium]